MNIRYRSCEQKGRRRVTEDGGLSVLIKHSSSNSSIRLVRQSQSLLSPLSPSQSFAWLSLNSKIPPFPHHPIVATLYINLLLILSTLLSHSITQLSPSIMIFIEIIIFIKYFYCLSGWSRISLVITLNAPPTPLLIYDIKRWKCPSSEEPTFQMRK